MITHNKNGYARPELLLPAGKIEAFYAAVEGGADAVYLGLKNFNARARAGNFTVSQLYSLCSIAHKKNVKVFVTLNTVIKNKELPDLLRLLYQINKSGIDAVIIQDWGLFSLLRKYFPNIRVHASTQMSNHNSFGAAHASRAGFSRVILARELTLSELSAIRGKTSVELEVFVHGALCYSFSGMCLASSYYGGRSANRGMCAQSCRRLYKTSEKQKFLFNLKDNQLVEYIRKLGNLGIHSFKVEGRLRSAEYVYNTARAYRLALDNPQKQEQAKKILENDFGREKTSGFPGKNIKNAVSCHPASGIFLGRIQKCSDRSIHLAADDLIKEGSRIRIFSEKRLNETFRVHAVIQHKNAMEIQGDFQHIRAGDQVYLIGTNEKHFSSRLPDKKASISSGYDKKGIEKIIRDIDVPEKPEKVQLYLRIDSPDWLRRIHLGYVDRLILKFTKNMWRSFACDKPLIQKFRHKMIIELPRFISEKDADFFSGLCAKLAENGLNVFSLSHLSQMLMLPANAGFGTNEQVCCFNDAAVEYIRFSGGKWHIYPYENDMDNLVSGKDRSGILPLYFHPELFFSRVPAAFSGKITDSYEQKLEKKVRGGITSIIPEKPVSLFHYKHILINAGFKKFLIDLSYELPSKNRFNALLSRFDKGGYLQESSSFNFKTGLQ